MKKYIIKHKTVLCSFFVLLFPILLVSCKTCDCPAYSQNNGYKKEFNIEKIDISVQDSLIAMQKQKQNIGLTN